MQAVLNVALPVFGIILCGYLAGRVKLLGATSSEALNAFVYWFALPPLIFIGMAETPLDRIFHVDFILSVSIGIAATGVVVVLGSRFLFGNRGASNGMHAMTALFSNTGYMGIPLFIAAFGEDRVLPAVTATVLNMFFYGAMTAWVAAVKDDTDRRSAAEIAGSILAALAKNPLVVAPVIGIAISAARITVPVPLENLCRILGDAAAPGALFALGLFLVGQRVTAGLAEIGWITFFKLIAQPALTWWLAFYVFEMDRFWAVSSVLLAALPTGALVFVTAQQNGVYVQRASAGIVMTTMFSVVTLTAVLGWFGRV
ncbi:MAG: AEC family transporter [Alphaproteobacteria bacterium]